MTALESPRDTVALAQAASQRRFTDTSVTLHRMPIPYEPPAGPAEKTLIVEGEQPTPWRDGSFLVLAIWIGILIAIVIFRY